MDDHAYLCGSGGVIWMDTASRSGISDSRPMLIDYITVDGETVYVQGLDQLDIATGTHRIELSAHMLSFTQENPTMFYYMEGFDDTYHYVSYEKLSPIIYTNIPGGAYTFHFGVYDPETSSPGQEITVKLNVAFELLERPPVQISLVAVSLFAAVLILWFIFWLRSSDEKRKLQRAYSEKEQEILKKMAYTDYLTGLYNRNYLSQYDTIPAYEHSYPICLTVIDCNNLKLINDRFGHSTGDELLLTLTELMKKHFPGQQSLLFRMGGDEFLVITEGLAKEEAEKCIFLITQEAWATLVGGLPVSFSYGIAECSEPARYNLKRLIHQADELMVLSKQQFHRLDEPKL